MKRIVAALALALDASCGGGPKSPDAPGVLTSR